MQVQQFVTNSRLEFVQFIDNTYLSVKKSRATDEGGIILLCTVIKSPTYYILIVFYLIEIIVGSIKIKLDESNYQFYKKNY